LQDQHQSSHKIFSGGDIIDNVTILPIFFLLFQNNQYVKSKQVIVEILAGTYALNLKEKVRKHIYFDLRRNALEYGCVSCIKI